MFNRGRGLRGIKVLEKSGRLARRAPPVADCSDADDANPPGLGKGQHITWTDGLRRFLAALSIDP